MLKWMTSMWMMCKLNGVEVEDFYVEDLLVDEVEVLEDDVRWKK